MKLFTVVVLILLAVSIGYTQSVDFKVNMSVQMKRGLFNPATDSVFVIGSLTGWTGDSMLTDANNDSIYDRTLTLTPGDTLQFKFRFVHAGTYTWENDPNRTYIVPAGSGTYEDYFNRDSVYLPQVDIATTFSVNMELERLSGRFHPGTDTVSVNGDFQGWSAKVDLLTPNPLNPDLYEGTFTIHKAEGEGIQFKFWYQPNNWESVDNRVYTFTASDVGNGYAVYSGSFNNGTLENVLNQPCKIKYTVDANGAVSSVNGLPFPELNNISIAGSALPLQWPQGGWPNSDSIVVIRLYDDGTHGDATAGDKVFTDTLTFAPYTVLQVQYKYGANFGDGVNNGGGNDNESGFAQNHVLNMTRFMTNATVVDTFGRMQVSHLTNVLAPVPVTFNVNMGVQMKRGLFDKTLDTVSVIGSFTSWATDYMLTDPNNDSIYSATANINAGDTIQFKYRFSHNGSLTWENDPNRTFAVPADGGTYTDFFNRDSVYKPQVDINMTFSVNMELERLSGRFHPGTDTVSVNGDFQGWTAKLNILTPNPLNPDLYEGTFVIHKAEGEGLQFKFWYQPNNWESVDNRVYTFTASDITNGSASYSGSFNNGTLETVLNQVCTIKFTVNANGAVSSVSGLPFPALNTISIAGSALPLQWPAGGWPNSDSSVAIKLYDDGTNGDATAGDKIFTGVLTFPAYTVLQVQYKYGANWGDADNNGGGNDNESGFAQNHTLNFTRTMSSATVIDTFGRMHDAVLDNPTGVKMPPKIPTSYGLTQNYPNPFNPTTSITYMLPKASDVVLKVYDIFGREVATLVNERKAAGEYTATLGASGLASGIYYYRVIAGTFIQTKKMMLVK